MIAETAGGNASTGHPRRRPPRQRGGGPGHQRQRQRSAGLLEVAEAMADENPRQQDALRLVGRPRSSACRADALRRRPATSSWRRSRCTSTSTWSGSPNYVRFVYDGDNSAFPPGRAWRPGPAGSGDIEDDVPRLLHQPGLPLGGDTVQRSQRLRPVHREWHPVRWPVHRRRGHEDRAQARCTAARPGQPTTTATTRLRRPGNVNMRAIGEMSGAVRAAVWRLFAGRLVVAGGQRRVGRRPMATGTGELLRGARLRRARPTRRRVR